MFKRFSAIDSWNEISYTVYIFMFLTHVYPLNPYITAYLIGPDGNISLPEITIIINYVYIYVCKRYLALNRVIWDNVRNKT